MYPVANLESYQKQANDLVAKINQLQQLQPQINPFVTTPPPPQIDYVKGIDGARSYLQNMPANGKKILMDQDEALFYIASKDANGVPAPIVIGKFELQMEQEPEAPVYVTKHDFDQFKEELKSWLKGDKA